MNDKREQLYKNLIGSGMVNESNIGSLDDFRNAIKDEESSRKFYDNLRDFGFTEGQIGSQDDFFNSISSDFQPTDTTRQRVQQQPEESAVGKFPVNAPYSPSAQIDTSWQTATLPEEQQGLYPVAEGAYKSPKQQPTTTYENRLDTEVGKVMDEKKKEYPKNQYGLTNVAHNLFNKARNLIMGYDDSREARKELEKTVYGVPKSALGDDKAFGAYMQEEQNLNAKFPNKPYENDNDIYTYYQDRFAQTEDGKKAIEERDKAFNEYVINEWFPKFQETEEYKSVVGKQYNTQEEGNKALNEAFNNYLQKNSDAVNEGAQGINDAYNNAFMDRYGKRITRDGEVLFSDNLSNENHKKLEESRNNIQDIQNRTNKRMREVEKEKIGHSTSAGFRNEFYRSDEEFSRLEDEMDMERSINKLLTKTDKIVSAAKDGDQSFFNQMNKAIGNEAQNVDNWTFGISELIDNARLNSLLKKAESGDDLTEQEKRLLDAASMNMILEGYYRERMSRGYTVGETTAVSLPFMIEFIANPISSSGNAIAKGLLNYALRNGGRGVAKAAIKAGGKTALKIGTNLLGQGIAATGTTFTSGLAGTTADAIRRLNQNYVIENEDGDLEVKKYDKDDYRYTSEGEALGKAIATRTFENLSEMIWNPFRKLVTSAGRAGITATEFNRLFGDKAPNAWARAWRWLDNAIFNNPTLKAVAQRAQFHGLPEEYAEEVINNLMNVGIGEMSIEDAIDLDNNIDTFMSLVPTSALFGAIGVGTYALQRKQLRDMKEELLGKLDGDLKKKLSALEQLPEFTGFDDISDQMRAILMDSSKSKEQKKDALKFLYYTAQDRAMAQIDAEKEANANGTTTVTPEQEEQAAAAEEAKAEYNAGTEAMTATPEEQAIAEAEESRSAGYETVEPAAMNDTNNEFDALVEEMKDAFSPEVIQAIDENPMEEIKAIFANPSYTDEQRQQVLDYVNAKQRYDGMLQRVRDDIDTEIEASNAEIDSQVNKATGTVIPATLKADNRQVHIIDGNVVMYEDGSGVDTQNSSKDIIVRDVETGNLEFISPADIESAEQGIDAEELKQQTAENIRQTMGQQALDKINGTVTYNQGDTYNVVGAEGQPATVQILQDNGDGTVMVAIDGQQAEQPMQKQAVQEMVDRARMQQVQARRAEARAARAVTAAAEQTETPSEETSNGTEAAAVEEPTGESVGENGQPAVTAEVETPAEGTAEVETPVEGTAEATTEAVEQDEPMPMDEEGEPVFGSVTPQRAQRYIYNETGLPTNKADQLVEYKKKEAQKKLDALRKQEPQFGDKGIGGSVTKLQNAMAQWQQQVDNAEREVNYWNSVEQEQAMKLRQAEEAAKAEEARKADGDILAKIVDPRKMSDEEKSRRGEMLRSATAIPVQTNQIVSSEGVSARKAAIDWWNRNVPEPLHFNTEIGDVEVNRNSIESSLAHKYSQAKLDAVTSLPDGFENAVYLGTMPDSTRQKGTYDHYFAYPIDYNGKRCYVFCRALQDNNTNRLYVHEVFIADNIKEKGNTLQTAASQPHGGIALYRDILANVLLSESKDNTSSDNIQENQQENITNNANSSEANPKQDDGKDLIRAKAKEWEDKVGVKVNLVERIDDVPNANAKRAIEDGLNVTGWYDTNTGEIFLYMPNIDSQSEVDRTYLHEVVAHKGLRQLLGDEAFNELCDEVFASMSEADKERFMNYPGVDKKEGKERERAAADEYMAHLAEDTSLNPTMWEKIVAAIREALRRIGADIQMTDADIAYILNRSYNNLVSTSAERLRDEGIEVDEERGDALFAVRDVLEGKELEDTVKELMDVTGRSEKTVRNWIKAEQSLAKVILDEDNVKFLDMQVDESVPSIWNNSDYPQGTVEFSNICRKRLPFTMIYQRMQKEFPNMVFDASTLEDIRQTMKANGADVACGLCFVEDRRQLLGEIGQGFIDALEGKNTDLNENQAKALSQVNDKYIPNLYDLLTLDGMKKLRKKHPSIAQAFVEYNNARGMQAGRLFQAYSAYHREILDYTPAKVKSINDNGGLRIFSFSDFEAHHLIDLVQVLTDAAAKGIKVQGYTKVPEFAKAVKDTGAKINRSLIAKGKGVVDEDYQPKKGEFVSPNVIDGKRLLFDTVEGIDVSHPDFFDSTDSKNVGNILVGINDEQIKMAMRDPFVDYIIPFHSGLSKEIRDKKGIGEWVNYKLKQLEKKLSDKGKLVNADKHGINIYTDVLPRGNELIGREIKNAKDFQQAFFAAAAEKGWTPRFWEFIDKDKKGNYKYTPGYEKLLIDFKLFDKNGKLIPQEAVQPIFDNDFNKKILDDYVKGEKEKMPNDELYAKVKESLKLNTPAELEGIDPNSIDNDISAEEAEEANVRFRVANMEEVMKLESEPKAKRYRAMVEIDGKLYPPMSVYVDGRLRNPTELNVWERADETPFAFTDEQRAAMDALDAKEGTGYVDIVPDKLRYVKGGKTPYDPETGKGSKGTLKFKLQKDNGETVWAAYNPYFHTSTSGLNDQFKSAYKRPNLVVAEVEIPEEETGKVYKADYAKNSTGDTPWHSGTVNGALPKDRQRTVTLSRYAKVTRVVPDAEVAEMIASQLEGTDIEVPYNVVTPSLRDELVKQGVKIGAPEKGMEEANEEYEKWKDSDVRFRVDEVNRQFNEELDKQINGTLPSGHIYNLGLPSEILQSTGFPNVPIEMSATHLEDKSKAAHHPFEIKEMKNLVDAIQNPLAVFAYGNKDKSQNVIVEIQHDGKNFVVGIHFNQKRGNAEVSSIRGLYPKDNAEWLNWITQKKLLYVDKEKVQALIDQQRRTLADVEYLDLNSVANLIKDFDNPKLQEENIGKNNNIRFRIDDGKTEEIFDTAEKTFGTTRDIREAGYVLPNGDMLDFSGRHEGADERTARGQRHSDHRQISSIAYRYDEDGNEVETGVETTMPEFIDRGAIRIDNNAGFINLSNKPTSKQKNALRTLISYNGGDVQVDFGNGWDSDHYVEYDGAKATRVLGDIDRYFDEGIKPEGSIRFRVSNAEDQVYMDAVKNGDMETAQKMVDAAAKQSMPNTKVVDADGNPLLMSHHTNNEGFYTFDKGRIGTGQGQAFLGIGFNFSRGYGSSTYGNRNISAYLNAENPLRSDGKTLSKRDIRSIILELNKKNGTDRIEDSWGSMNDAVDAMYDYGGDLDVYATIGMTYSGESVDVMDAFAKRGYDSTIEYNDNGEIMNAVVFDSNQIKSAEPITYDDNGNVIPLSERFNQGNNDIRFSIRGEVGAAAAKDSVAMENLDVAKKMDAEGKDAKAIWLATGWEKGKDGKWRNEIPDAKPKPIDPKKAKTIDDIIDAPELFASYPSLKDYTVEFTKLDKDVIARINHDDKTVKLDTRYNTAKYIPEEKMDEIKEAVQKAVDSGEIQSRNDWTNLQRRMERKYMKTRISAEGLRSILHEMQHAIQRIEGFAIGGNIRNLTAEQLNDARRSYPELMTFHAAFGKNTPKALISAGKDYIISLLDRYIANKSFPDAFINDVEQLRDLLAVFNDKEYATFVRDSFNVVNDANKKGKDTYKKLTGEVEARNVERRSSMDEEGRRTTPPSETEDVKREEQEVRFRITPEQDAEYMKAVEDNDMDKAAEMVKEAVKKAMSDTKVVDADGNPMIVYHGSPSEGITAFDMERAGWHTGAYGDHAIYSTDSKDEADIFSHEMLPGSTSFTTRLGKKGTVYPLYLNMKNPFDMSKVEGSKEMQDVLKSMPQIGDGAFFDSAMRAITEAGNHQLAKIFLDYDKLQELGYDGVIARMYSYYNGNDAVEYGVFNPKQIKSAEPVVYDDNGKVVPLSERFNPESNDIRFRIGEQKPVFISNAQSAVESIKQDKATPQQWLAMLTKNGGIKAGEDKWLGLSDWLKDNDSKSLTKQEVLDYIRKNEIQVEEVEYEDMYNIYNNPRMKELRKEYDDIYNEMMDNQNSLRDEIETFEDEMYEKYGEGWVGKLNEDEQKRLNNQGEEYEEDIKEKAFEEMVDRYGDDFRDAFELDADGGLSPTNDWNGGLSDAAKYFLNTNTINDTRLSYTTEGLDNKKEIALVVPTIESWQSSDNIHFGDAGEGRAVAWIRFGDTTTNLNSRKASRSIMDDLEQKYGSTDDYDKMSDEDVARRAFANYLERGDDANERTSKTLITFDVGEERAKNVIPIFEKLVKDHANGERVLVIDEIQSNRHQEGREKGYDNTWSETVNEIADATGIEKQRIESNPYDVANWMDAHAKGETGRELAQRLRDEYTKHNNAVPDAPFDRNWHELAMKRMLRYAAENGYDKVAWTKGAQQADRYSLSKTIPSITRKDTKKASDKGIRIFEMDINGEPQKVFVNNDGTITNTTMFMDEVTGKPLSDFVGKEIAVKMMTMKDGETIDTSKEKVGGEGMKGFYDEILPRFMNKYGKKWGVKVGEVELPNVEEAGRTMWSVDVTPEMKESVMQGQPLFRIAEQKPQEEALDADERYDAAVKDGLRSVVGSRYNDLLMDIYEAAPEPIRRKIADAAMRNGLDFQRAIEEYLASLAENGNFEEAKNAGLWDRIKEMFADEFGNIEDSNLRYALWRNSKAKEQEDIFDNAEDIAMSSELGADDIRYRIGQRRPTPRVDSANLNEWVRKATEEITAKHDAENEDRTQTIQAIGGALASIRRAMTKQWEYDKNTVKAITDLANAFITSDYAHDLNKAELKTLLAAVKNAVGKADLRDSVRKVMEMMIKHQIGQAEKALSKLKAIKGEKVNASGVAVQGKLDIQGQKVMKAYKDAINNHDSAEDIANRMAELENLIADTEDDANREQYEAEYAGLQLAADYVNNIEAAEKETRDLVKQRQDLKSEKSSMSSEEYDNLMESIDDAIMQSMTERLEAYGEHLKKVATLMQGSIEGAKDFIKRDLERVNNIHHLANSDMEGTPTNEHYKGSSIRDFYNNSIVRFFLKPLATLDMMLRSFGQKSPRGEGSLWNYYMRKWVDATDNEFKMFKEDTRELDRMMSYVMGRRMRWSDIYSMERSMPKVKVEFYDGGEKKAHELTQGNLLYIYMANKMTDGKMKLRAMGISEEDVQNLVDNYIDPRFIQLADWLQDDYLVQKRNDYNKVHERMFGAPMAAIDNYFPLKILSNARVQEVDVNNITDEPILPSTTTGAIIKRVKNVTALDILGTDAFSLVIEHLQQMDKWANFAELNRDFNTLLSYKRFRNQVLNLNGGLYGSGNVLWENFKNAVKIAVGTYRPKGGVDSIDKSAVNIAKGVTAAKISFRIYTALKQTLSAPAFLSEAGIVDLVKNTMRPMGTWDWAMKNLPMFAKRVESRKAGDTRLEDTPSDWKAWSNQVVQMLSRVGMSPNAFVDALTCSIGARSVYESKYRKYKQYGLSDEQAHKRAIQDAEIAYNSSQQSSEGAFLSDIQVDRTVASVALSAFRNSSFGYQRQWMDAVRNLKRRAKKGYKERAIEAGTKRWMREGLDEDKARKAATDEYESGLSRDLTRIAIYGFVLEVLWSLGSAVPYLLLGDDDGTKDKMLSDAFRKGMAAPFEGLTLGSVISEATGLVTSGQSLRDYNPELLPIISDVKKVINDFGYDKMYGYTDLINLAVQAGFGVNPQTMTDVVAAVLDGVNGDMNSAREVMLLLMRIMQVPSTSTDNIYIDEMAAKVSELKDLSVSDFTKRYVDYKMNKNTPVTQFFYNDEDKEKAEERYEKQFNNKVSAYESEIKDWESIYKDTDKSVKNRIKEIRKQPNAVQAMEEYKQTRQYQDWLIMDKYNKRSKKLKSLINKTDDKEKKRAYEDELQQLKQEYQEQIRLWEEEE